MRWMAFALVVLYSVPAFAEDPPMVERREVQSIPPGDDKITPVTAGEKAPYTGQLFSPDTALRWANWLEQYRTVGDEDFRLQQRACVADHQYQEEQRKVEAEAAAKVERDLRARLLESEDRNTKLQEELKNPPWYKTRTFSVVVGAAGASVLLVSGAVVVNVARE